MTGATVLKAVKDTETPYKVTGAPYDGSECTALISIENAI